MIVINIFMQHAVSKTIFLSILGIAQVLVTGIWAS